jgi:hypothetical protein
MRLRKSVAVLFQNLSGRGRGTPLLLWICNSRERGAHLKAFIHRVRLLCMIYVGDCGANDTLKFALIDSRLRD